MGAEVQVLTRRRPQVPGADVVEEVEWLLSFGMHAERIVEALGMTPLGVTRALERQGRSDLAVRLRACAA